MAAPTYTWQYIYDIHGANRVPTVATLEAAASLETKVGTLLVASSGQVAAAGDTCASVLGLALEATSAALSAGDPIQVAILAPGMVIRGTADADATALAGFSGKTVDLNANGSLDVADTTNGSLTVYRVDNAAGTSVDVVPTVFATA